MRALFARLVSAFRSLYIFDRPGCQVRLSLRQRLPLALFPLLLLGYLVRPSPVMAVSAAAVGLLLLLSYLWARAMAQKVSAERRLRYAALQVGDELEEEIKLKNSSGLPAIWAEFVDQSNLPGYTVSSVRSADGSSSIEWRANTTCTRRGVFTLGPWDLCLGDPFGLFLVRQTTLQKNDILVYPPLAPLPRRLLPRGQVLGEQRPLHQPLQAETQDAFTARPYQPGDPLRHIHWPITARHESPFVKVFEPEDASTVWLLADLDAAVQVGQGPDSSLETMILLLASLASELLRQRMAVGLIAYSGADAGVPQVVLPQRSPQHLWDILRTLAVLSPAPGRPFEETLQQSRTLVGGRDQVLAVTPSLQPAWLGALHQLNGARRGQGASVILLDPASFADEADLQPVGADLRFRPDTAEGAGAGPYPPEFMGGQGTQSPTPNPSPRGGEIEFKGFLSLMRDKKPKKSVLPSLWEGLGVGSYQAGPPLNSPGAADAFAQLLLRQGIHASVIRRGELHPLSGAYGQLSRWDFKTLGTGRVFVRHAPRSAAALGDK